MAMNVQVGDHSEDPELNTTINTTPLVDVMLVMLIIFLVTIPVIVKAVPVQLPNARNIAKPENIVVAVDKDENIYYNNEPIDQGELKLRFEDALRRAIASGHPYPEVHIRGDKDVRFEAVGRVVLACQLAGIPKVGFLTEPRNSAQ
jgi:biopolymer transport protein ExbD